MEDGLMDDEDALRLHLAMLDTKQVKAGLFVLDFVDGMKGVKGSPKTAWTELSDEEKWEAFSCATAWWEGTLQVLTGVVGDGPEAYRNWMRARLTAAQQ